MLGPAPECHTAVARGCKLQQIAAMNQGQAQTQKWVAKEEGKEGKALDKDDVNDSDEEMPELEWAFESDDEEGEFDRHSDS